MNRRLQRRSQEHAREGQDVSVKKTKSDLLLTERALRDIADIERFSIAKWGKATAAKYIGDIEAAFSLLKELGSLTG